MPVIEVSHLHKRYGARVAVDDVSFSVERGEIFGLLGPNGAGKTTTVEAISGLRVPDGGSVRVLGRDPQRDRQALRSRVGVQLQHGELPERIRVGEALQLYSSFYDHPADWRALLERLGLGELRDACFRTLSGGQKQRLSIALALVGQPTVAILDELTTGLDPAARRETWDLVERVRGQGVTVLLVTHFMPEAEHLADRVAVLSAGRVVALDTPAALTSRVDAEQRMRFRPSRPVDLGLLTPLPEVTSVQSLGDQLLVAGRGDLVAAVTSVLARAGVIAHQLRLEQPSLDDAFIAITGRRAAASAPDGSSR
jgi:ABC-2 type transport system ATP-binding protein